MNERKKSANALILIANALLWAGLILAAAYVFKGTPFAEEIPLFGVAGYFIVSGILTCAMASGSRQRDQAQAEMK